MKTIQVKKLINIHDSIDVQEGGAIRYNVGYDGNLYLILQEKLPKRIESGIGSFPNPHVDSKYTVLIVNINFEEVRIDHIDKIELGSLEYSFQKACPLGDHILMLGMRCWYDSEAKKGEDNAYVFSRSGKLEHTMCLGDGISHVLTFPDNRIVTGYFDEGVFGNFGWFDPLGSSGLVVWDFKGNKLWENPDGDIVDVYDMRYGADGTFWYYAYTDFNLTHVDRSYHKSVYEMDTEGCYDILFDKQNEMVLFDGGYHDRNTFYSGLLKNGRIEMTDKVEFKSNDDVVDIKRIESSPENTFFIDGDLSVYLPQF